MTDKLSECDLILKNARLRDELEPYQDESMSIVDLDSMSTANENRYLSSLLAWERAPVRPIQSWFEPALHLPPPDSLGDRELHQVLHQTIGRLLEKNIVLQQTGHLSDRQLYTLIVRDILPSQEKQMELSESKLRWRCLDEDRDEEAWLRYYASDEERAAWAFDTGLKLPPRSEVPFRRNLPT